MKVDLLLPTSLSEIPLSRYQDFIAMKEKSNDEEFIAQKMIQIFCNIKLGEVAQIRLKDLNELIDHFSKIFTESNTNRKWYLEYWIPHKKYRY